MIYGEQHAVRTRKGMNAGLSYLDARDNVDNADRDAAPPPCTPVKMLETSEETVQVGSVVELISSGADLEAAIKGKFTPSLVHSVKDCRSSCCRCCY